MTHRQFRIRRRVRNCYFTDYYPQVRRCRIWWPVWWRYGLDDGIPYSPWRRSTHSEAEAYRAIEEYCARYNCRPHRR